MMTSTITVSFFFLLAVWSIFSLSDAAVVSREKRVPSTPVLAVRKDFSRTVAGRTSACEWFGSAPICNGFCPPGYDFMRRAKYPPHGERFTFGSDCFMGKKMYCCSADAMDCSLSGKWTSGKYGINYYCQHEHQVSSSSSYSDEGGNRKADCGTLRCQSADVRAQVAEDRMQIGGESCETIIGMFGGNDTKATAFCGQMQVNQGERVYDFLFKA